MASRALNEQAKGVLVTLHRCDADAACARLSPASRSTSTELRDLAADLVTRAALGTAD